MYVGRYVNMYYFNDLSLCMYVCMYVCMHRATDYLGGVAKLSFQSFSSLVAEMQLGLLPPSIYMSSSSSLL